MSEKNTQTISGRKLISTDSMSIHKMFLTAILLSTLIIIVGTTAQNPLISVFGPIVIMGIYIVLVFQTKTDLPKSVAGDSFYYLGFILTMISLVISLLYLSFNVSSLEINSVIGTFGAALSTTILGLIARMMTSSFSMNTKQRREQLDEQIGVALEKFLGQLTAFNESTINAQNSAAASVNNVLYEVSQTTQENINEINNSFKKSIERLEEQTETAVTGLNDKIAQIDVDSNLITKPITEQMTKFITTLSNQNESLFELSQKVVSSNNTMTSQLDNSNSLLQNHISGLEEKLNNVIQNQAKEYSKLLNEISESIMGSFGDVKDFKMAINESLNNEVEQLGKQVSSLSEGLNNFDRSVATSSKNFKELVESYSTSNEAKITLQAHTKTIVDEFKALEGVVSGLNMNITSFSNKFSAFSTEIEKSSQLASDTGNSIKEIKVSNESAAKQLADDISHVYSKLATQLSRIKE